MIVVVIKLTEPGKFDEYVASDTTFPPQSSVKLESHGKLGQRYYTWEVKVYCDDLDKALDEVDRIHKKMASQYGQTE